MLRVSTSPGWGAGGLRVLTLRYSHGRQDEFAFNTVVILRRAALPAEEP